MPTLRTRRESAQQQSPGDRPATASQFASELTKVKAEIERYKEDDKSHLCYKVIAPLYALPDCPPWPSSGVLHLLSIERRCRMITDDQGTVCKAIYKSFARLRVHIIQSHLPVPVHLRASHLRTLTWKVSNVNQIRYMIAKETLLTLEHSFLVTRRIGESQQLSLLRSTASRCQDLDEDIAQPDSDGLGGNASKTGNRDLGSSLDTGEEPASQGSDCEDNMGDESEYEDEMGDETETDDDTAESGVDQRSTFAEALRLQRENLNKRGADDFDDAETRTIIRTLLTRPDCPPWPTTGSFMILPEETQCRMLNASGKECGHKFRIRFHLHIHVMKLHIKEGPSVRAPHLQGLKILHARTRGIYVQIPYLLDELNRRLAGHLSRLNNDVSRDKERAEGPGIPTEDEILSQARRITAEHPFSLAILAYRKRIRAGDDATCKLAERREIILSLLDRADCPPLPTSGTFKLLPYETRCRMCTNEEGYICGKVVNTNQSLCEHTARHLSETRRAPHLQNLQKIYGKSEGTNVRISSQLDELQSHLDRHIVKCLRTGHSRPYAAPKQPRIAPKMRDMGTQQSTAAIPTAPHVQSHPFYKALQNAERQWARLTLKQRLMLLDGLLELESCPPWPSNGKIYLLKNETRCRIQINTKGEICGADYKASYLPFHVKKRHLMAEISERAPHLRGLCIPYSSPQMEVFPLDELTSRLLEHLSEEVLVNKDAGIGGNEKLGTELSSSIEREGTRLYEYAELLMHHQWTVPEHKLVHDR